MRFVISNLEASEAREIEGFKHDCRYDKCWTTPERLTNPSLRAEFNDMTRFQTI